MPEEERKGGQQKRKGVREGGGSECDCHTFYMNHVSILMHCIYAYMKLKNFKTEYLGCFFSVSKGFILTWSKT